MPIATVVESLDAVPEALREHYTEREGKYVLAASDLSAHPDVLGLKSAKDTLLGEKKRVADELAAYKALGLSAEEIRELKEAREKAEEGTLKDQGAFEALKQKLAERHTAELGAKEGEIKRRDQFIERLLIDNRLDAATEKVGVLPEYRAAVKALLKARGPKVTADGDDYRAYIPTDMGDAEIATYVEEWARTDEAAAFLKAKGTGGSGAVGGNGGGATPNNPWKRETHDLTEQGRILRENPELARRLAAQAGAKITL